jgi:hypothetical protein
VRGEDELRAEVQREAPVAVGVRRVHELLAGDGEVRDEEAEGGEHEKGRGPRAVRSDRKHDHAADDGHVRDDRELHRRGHVRREPAPHDEREGHRWREHRPAPEGIDAAKREGHREAHVPEQERAEAREERGVGLEHEAHVAHERERERREERVRDRALVASGRGEAERQKSQGCRGFAEELEESLSRVIGREHGADAEARDEGGDERGRERAFHERDSSRGCRRSARGSWAPMAVAPPERVVDTPRGMGDEAKTQAGKPADATLILKLAAVRDFAEAIGADDIVTPKEFTFLKQKVSELVTVDEGESVDSLARQAIRLFAPQAKPEAVATLPLRVAKLKPSVDAVCADGIVSLQEIDFLKRKCVELGLVKPSESPEQLVRAALQPVLGRVQLHPAAQAALAGAKLAHAAPITVMVTPDGREARAAMEKGQRWSPEDLARALADARVTHGIDKRWLEGRMPIVQPGNVIVLARATEPTAGEARTVSWHVAQRSLVEVQALAWNEPLRFELDALAVPNLVAAGTLLAQLSPPSVGAPGISVRGEPMPGVEGPSPRVFAGLGVALVEDGLAFEAQATGALVARDDGVLAVYPVLEVAGSAAPVELVHEGAVVVQGDLVPGSRIVATGDVRVQGAVEGASVLAGGSVVVDEGVVRKGSVRAAGDVVVRRVESESVVEAGGNVFVRADAMGSRVEAGSYVVVLGAVTGGVVRAHASVEADSFVLGRATNMLVEVKGVAEGASAAELLGRIEELEQQAARARGALAGTLAEAGATKLALTKPALPAGPSRPSSLLRAAAPHGASPSLARAAAPANETLVRTPPTSFEEYTGEAFTPLTTAAALRIDLHEDEAVAAAVEASFLRARLPLAEGGAAAPFPPRVFARSSFGVGVRAVVEGARFQVTEELGGGVLTLHEGAVTHHARAGLGGSRR